MKETVFVLFLLQPVIGTNMNQGGVPYAISNPPGSTDNWEGTPGKYSTDFEDNVAGKVEHFDVYGEVQTMYSQVRYCSVDDVLQGADDVLSGDVLPGVLMYSQVY